MEKYHYLGKVYLYGNQIRYLIKSSKYGWLGGFSFSASAWSFLNWRTKVKNYVNISCQYIDI